MAQQETTASGNGPWHLVAPTGNLIALVYPGMRVGADAVGCFSFEPEDALIELGIERDQLIVHVLACAGEPETPPIRVNSRTRVRINFPNDSFVIDPGWANGNSSSDTIEIQVLPPRHAATDAGTEADPSTSEHTGDIQPNPASSWRQWHQWHDKRIYAALVSAGLLALIFVVFQAQETTTRSANAQVAQSVGVETVNMTVRPASQTIETNSSARAAQEIPTAPPTVPTSPPQVPTAPPQVPTAPPQVTTAPPTVPTAPPMVNESVSAAGDEAAAESPAAADTPAVADTEKNASIAAAVEPIAPPTIDTEPSGVDDEVSQFESAGAAQGEAIAESTAPPSVEETLQPGLELAEQAVEIDASSAAVAASDDIADAIPDVAVDSTQNEQIATIPSGTVLAGFTSRLVREESVLTPADQNRLADSVVPKIGEIKLAGEPDAEPLLAFGPPEAMGVEPQFNDELSFADERQAPAPDDVGAASPMYPYGDLIVVRQRPPAFPRQAPFGASGFVDMEFTVTETGEVEEVEVKGDPPVYFSRAAVKAVRKWRFEGVVVDGKRVPVRTRLRLTFRG